MTWENSELQAATVALAESPDHHWEWFATITFRYPVRSLAASRILFSYLAGLPSLLRPTDVLWGTELHRNGGAHLHCLMNSGYCPRSWKDWNDDCARWMGWARWYPYDPKRGAAWYVTKYVLKETSSADASWGWWGKEELLDELVGRNQVSRRMGIRNKRFARAEEAQEEVEEELDRSEEARRWLKEIEQEWQEEKASQQGAAGEDVHGVYQVAHRAQG